MTQVNGDDHAMVMPSGYTAIEEYVNELSDELVGAAHPAPTVSVPTSGGSRVAADTTDDHPGPLGMIAVAVLVAGGVLILLCATLAYTRRRTSRR